ncbi:hypothetical protein [Pseudoalteromonas sp. SK20]|uniref:hypothetical protein n=1 Tax=Pseudoalteromonas sp. SK20 TaxID=1938367 RepID=UPI00111594FD|nr:hypothetical protein [Pseudoalteromonas sp. SK20]
MINIFLKKVIVTHILISFLLITLLYFIVIPLWYPSDLSRVSASSKIFKILVSIEVGLFIGLILLLFIGRNNSGKEVLIIYFIFFSLQVGAAFIGIKTLYEAKPMYIVYEFDRFRIVRPIDIFWGKENKEYNFFTGPQFYSAKEYPSSDIRLLKSIKDSIDGFYPSFKKERLIPYEGSKTDIINNSNRLVTLSDRKLKKVIELLGEINIDTLGYYPLVSHFSDEWIIIISLSDAKVLGYLHINGWNT